ncbi:hypothetical protein, partial [Paracoccus liaowanqingii]|uniref:hypothetical protein n=1 Tax=Paracoccus liaowanqingii TaxID=2560053 RepID=UPI00197CF773
DTFVQTDHVIKNCRLQTGRAIRFAATHARKKRSIAPGRGRNAVQDRTLTEKLATPAGLEPATY